MTNGGSGRRSFDCVAILNHDHDGSFWKTSQGCLALANLEGRHSVRSSLIWPRCGWISSGTCYRQETLVRRTYESASGLSRAPLWPTPMARDWKDGHYCPNVPLNTLGRAVWPTPTAQDSYNDATPSQWKRNSDPLNVAVHRDGSSMVKLEGSGSLNPAWVEWLMGYPVGWTDCEDLATRSSHKLRSGSDDESSRRRVRNE